MTEERTHPGDVLLATCLLLGVEFKGDEHYGFQAVPPGSRHALPIYHSKRAAGANALLVMGFYIDPITGEVS